MDHHPLMVTTGIGKRDTCEAKINWASASGCAVQEPSWPDSGDMQLKKGDTSEAAPQTDKKQTPITRTEFNAEMQRKRKSYLTSASVVRPQRRPCGVLALWDGEFDSPDAWRPKL